MRRLSGWARLWVAFALIVWTLDVAMVATILATSGAPIDAELLIAVAIPFAVYGIIPLLVAALFILGKWVLQGFRPKSAPT